MKLLEAFQRALAGSYDENVAIYSQGIEADSPARIGNAQFENGGVLDNCEYFASFAEVQDFAAEYGGDPGPEELFEEFVVGMEI